MTSEFTKAQKVWQGLKYLENQAAMLTGRVDICAEHDTIYSMINYDHQNPTAEPKVAEVQRDMVETFDWMIDEENTYTGTLAFKIFV